MTLLNRSKLSQCGVVILVGLVLLCAWAIESTQGNAQTRNRRQAESRERRPLAREPDFEEYEMIARVVTWLCEERARDPQGSIPIDQMAAQSALPLTDARVIDGKKRAERLLPVAKKLVPSTLSRLAADYNLEPLSLSWIRARVQAVNTIKPEVEAHDNSYWRPSEPNAIIFGTIFLAGIRSDEAMITVLAHELTHAINGTDQSLQPLFARLGARASEIGMLPIQGNVAVELTCEAVGLQVMRAHIGKALGKGTAKHLARAVGKNCVQRDLADANHLSPRETMQVLLALEPGLIKALAVAEEKKRPKKISD